MKKIKYLSMAFVVIAACAAVIFAKANDTTVAVHNETSHNVGTAHVVCTDYSYTNISVSGAGWSYGSITGTAGSVYINGQAVNAGSVGTVIDANNDTLKVDFSGTNLIVVTNDQIVN
jgi:hypothetical protein